MRTIEELHGAGYDLFCFASKEKAIEHEIRLATCPLVDYVFETTETVFNHYPLFVLAAKRTSPTLKEMLKALEK